MKKLVGAIAFLVTLLTPAVAHAAISEVDKATLPVVNLLPNGGFEGGKIGWTITGTGNIITAPTTSIGSGKAALAWDASSAGQHILSDVIPVPARLAGKTGAFWCHFQTPSGNSTHQITMMAADGTTPLRTALTIESLATYAIKGSTFQFPLSGGVRLHAEAIAANEPLVNVDDCWVSDANGTLIQLLQEWPQYNITVTGTSWTTTRAVGIPYQTPDGSWRLRFNINGTTSAGTRTGYTAVISGVTFKSGTSAYQPISCSELTTLVNIQQQYATPGSGGMDCIHSSASTSRYGFSGDVELDSKPTWASDTRSTGIKLDQQIDFTSAIFMYPGDCPSGTIPATGKSLGKNSGDYQGANYFNLYSKLWALPGLSTTVGHPFRISSAKGASAQADWDALKTITIDFATNGLATRQVGGLSGVLGAYQADAYQDHTHGYERDVYFAGFQAGGSGAWGGTPVTGTTSGGTGNASSETRSKNVALNYCMNPSMVAPQPVVFKETQYQLTVTGTNWTTIRAVGVPYQTSDGAWRMRTNIQGNFSSGITTASLTVAGVTLKLNTNQSLSGQHSDGVDTWVKANANGYSNVWSIYTSAAHTSFSIGGDVELENKPTFVP